MHRPGIARVTGDRIVLDGTAAEEVARYHQRTLGLVVDATNAQHAEHLRREAAAARDEAAQRHREEVERGLGALRFDDDETASAAARWPPYGPVPRGAPARRRS